MSIENKIPGNVNALGELKESGSTSIVRLTDLIDGPLSTISGELKFLRLNASGERLEFAAAGGGVAKQVVTIATGSWVAGPPYTYAITTDQTAAGSLVQCWIAGTAVIPVSIDITGANQITISSSTNAEMDVVIIA